MGHLGGHVDGVRARTEHVEVLPEGLPLPPGHPNAERGAGDVLHALHEVDQRGVVVGAHRGEADAAVAHHEGRDPVRRRGLECVVPGRLAVVVGVDVDEAGRHERAVGVEDLTGRLVDRADLDHEAVSHGDVGGVRRRAGPVHDRPTLDEDVQHRASRLPRRSAQSAPRGAVLPTPATAAAVPSRAWRAA